MANNCTMAGDRLAGRVAMVTGAGRGVGAVVAAALAAEQAALAVCDLDPGSVVEVAEQVAQSCGARTAAVTVDVSDGGSVRAAVSEIESSLGPVDILVTCAGVEVVERFAESDGADWQRCIDVNLVGTFHCCRAVLDRMLERGRGRIITVGSDAGKAGLAGTAVYAASKGGVIAFTKSLAREVASRAITVNCLCPGPSDALMADLLIGQGPKLHDSVLHAISMGRLGRPEELAAAAVFLAADGAGYITGQAISVSGGLTMN